MYRFSGPAILWIIAVGISLTFPCAAQVSPGAPSFSAYDTHDADIINLQNLNVILAAPVYSKAGAIPFNWGLSANSYVYTSNPNTPSWVASMQASGLFGTLNGAGWATANYTASYSTNCPDHVTATTKYYNWVVTTSDSTVHALPTIDWTDSVGCWHTGFTDQVTDGTGYTLTVTSILTTTIHDRAGNLLTSSSISDVHGNHISLGGNTFTDTLGTHAMTQSGVTGHSGTYTWTDVKTGSPQVTVSSSSLYWQTNFSCQNVNEANLSGQFFPTSINYPDGTTLTIAYESTPGHLGHYTGRIGQLTLRTGGTVTYDYTFNGGFNCAYWQQGGLKRTTSDGVTTYAWTPTTHGNTTTVTDNGGNQTVYTFAGQAVTQVQHYLGATTLLTTDVYCYNGASSNCANTSVSLPISEIDVYHTISGMSASSRTQTNFDTYGNVTYAAQYDFGGGSPTYATTTAYGSCSGSCTGAIPTITPVGSNVNSKPGWVVKTQNGSTIGDARFTYNSKGDLLTTYLWTGFSFLSNPTVNVYNSNGTPSTTYDLSNRQTSYSYLSSGYVNCSGCLQYPFPTSITKYGLTTSSSYDGTGGVKLTDVDPSGNTTTYCYATGTICSGSADPYWRVLQIIDPYGATVTKQYPNGTNPNFSDSLFEFNSNTSIDGTSWGTDGYGRNVDKQIYQSPTATTLDTLSTSYGWNGNYSEIKTGQICSTTSGGACPVAHTYDYDPLGRLHTKVTTNNETLTNTYTNNDVSSVLTPAPSGENSKQAIREYDGLGRVSWTCKHGNGVSSACATGSSYTGLADTYSYTVPAAGSTKVAVTRGSQIRSQTFDALGRLTSKTTPEGGTWNYYYDTAACANSGASPGNMTCSTDPNGVTTVYFYDGLNRLHDVNAIGSYCRRYRYDSGSNAVTGTVPSGVTLANEAGRLMEAETDNCINPITPITDEWFAYDQDGRVTDMWQSSPHSTQYYHSQATFFENGKVKTVQLASPSLYTMTYGLDGEGRWNTLTDTTTSANIVTGTTFYPVANPAVVSLKKSRQ